MDGNLSIFGPFLSKQFIDHFPAISKKSGNRFVLKLRERLADLVR